MSRWGKLGYAVLFVVFGPIAIATVAIVAFGSFIVAGLFTGLILGLLDVLGLLRWNDTMFLIVTVPLAVVVAAWGVTHRDAW